MQAGIKTVEELLNCSSIYLVPHFQRSYSWGSRQWQQLWDDVTAIAADTAGRKHFIGPLVTIADRQLPGDTAAKYQVIDGQQRLTTLSIFLGAIGAVARDCGNADLAEEIKENYLVHHRKKDAFRYKLTPRMADRRMWHHLIDGNGPMPVVASSIDDAWEWFRSRIDGWTRQRSTEALNDLRSALSQRIAFVAITIADENPYRVFESLNTTGLPLTEFDLVRNHLFMRVPFDEQERFDEQNWHEFERLFDDCVRGDGRASKEATRFLRQFLMRTKGYFPKDEIFMQFRSWAGGTRLDPAGLLREMHPSALVAKRMRAHESLRDARQKGREGADWPIDEVDQRLLQIAYCDASTVWPLLFELLDAHERQGLARSELLTCLRHLVSFLVRRTLVGAKTRSYDREFAAIASRLEAPFTDNLVLELQRIGWPSDEETLRELGTFPIYETDPAKARLILEELERAEGNKEPVRLAQLQLEHVLPQQVTGSGANEWKQMLGDDWKKKHAQCVHTLGNLTLTGYNQSLSNKAFAKKREALRESRLELNKAITRKQSWTAEAILARTQDLGKSFLELFPISGERPDITEDDREGRTAKADNMRAFWQVFIEQYQARVENAFIGTPSGMAYMTVRTRYRCLNLVPYFVGKRGVAGIAASFRGDEGDRVFGLLRPMRATLASELGLAITEEPRRKYRSATLQVEIASLDVGSPGGDQLVRDWLIAHLPRFRKILEEQVAQIGSEERTQLALSEKQQARYTWYEQLLREARKHTELHATSSATPDQWLSARSGHRFIKYVYVVLDDHCRVELNFTVNRDDPKQTGRRLDWLYQHRHALESRLENLAWHPPGESKQAKLSISLEGGLLSPEEEWPRLQDRLIQTMVLLHETAQPLIEELVRSESD
jgi:hypothetical protein